MAIRNENEEIRAEGGSKEKKRKKAGILSLIMCLLVAFIIWCYAEAQVKKEEELEASKDSKTRVVEMSDNAQDAE